MKLFLVPGRQVPFLVSANGKIAHASTIDSWAHFRCIGHPNKPGDFYMLTLDARVIVITITKLLKLIGIPIQNRPIFDLGIVTIQKHQMVGKNVLENLLKVDI